MKQNKRNTRRSGLLSTYLVAVIVVMLVLALAVYFAYGLKTKKTWNQNSPSVSSSGFTIQSIEKKMNVIAFISEGNIWTVQPDGSDLTQLTKNTFAYTDPAVQKNVQRSYYSRISVSPDGSQIVAVALNKSTLDAIKSTDTALQQQYLVGAYWFPPHVQLELFDVRTGSKRILDLEEIGFEAANRINFSRIEFLPDNQHLLLQSTASHEDIMLDISKETPVAQRFPTNRLQLNDTYVPHMSSLFFDAIFHRQSTSTIIGMSQLGATSVNTSVVYEAKNEGQSGSVVAGNDGTIFFHTKKSGSFILQRFDPVTKKLIVLKEFSDCQNTTQLSCVNLPQPATGLTSFDKQYVSPNGKYIVASINEQNANQNVAIYRISDMKKVFPPNGKTLSTFLWSYDGNSIVHLPTTSPAETVELESGKVTVISRLPIEPQHSQIDWNALF